MRKILLLMFLFEMTFGVVLTVSAAEPASSQSDLLQRLEQMNVNVEELLNQLIKKKTEQKTTKTPPVPPATSVSVKSDESKDTAIYTQSQDTVQQASYLFKGEVSAFSPILSITLNGNSIPVKKGSYLEKIQKTLSLSPGENVITLVAKTESGMSQKEFKVFYETDLVQRNRAKKKSPFRFVAIAGYGDDDNANKSYDRSTAVRAVKSSLVFVPMWKHDFDTDSSLTFKMVVTGDRQYMADFETNEFLFRQVSLDWLNQRTSMGDVTLGLGGNELGLKDPNEVSKNRDTWSNAYKKMGTDVFGFLKFGFKASKTYSYSVKLDHKNKNTISTDERGNVQRLTLANNLSKNGGGWVTQLYMQKPDLRLDSKDQTEQNALMKFSFPFQSMVLSAQVQVASIEDRLANSLTGVKTKTRKTFYTAGIRYPVNQTMSLSYTRKQEREATNLENSDFYKNLNALQVAVIY